MQPLLQQLVLLELRSKCCWRCPRSCWELLTTSSWAVTSTGLCCYHKGYGCTPMSKSPSSSKKTLTSQTATGLTWPPDSAWRGESHVGNRRSQFEGLFIICTDMLFKTMLSLSFLQYFDSFQRDGEYLEPPSRFPAVFLSGAQWPLLSPASSWSRQRGLRHLRHRAVLLPGNTWTTSSMLFIFHHCWAKITTFASSLVFFSFFFPLRRPSSRFT